MTTAQLEPRAQAAAAGSTSAEPMVSIHGLRKRFPRRTGWRGLIRQFRRPELVTILDDISLDVQRGEFFGLLGPNGAGKTTLFKTLATLIQPDAGTACIAGHDLLTDPAGVRRVLTPVVPEERSLNWRLTSRQNLTLFAALHGLRGTEAADRIEELLGAVGLRDTGEKLVAEFSSGMRQRLLLARALLARPRVLLLDEPTRSLDPISARQFRRFLSDEIVGRHGCTVLLATHSAEEAFELCDRVGVLHRGRLLAVGRTQELARRFHEERYRLLLRPVPHDVLVSLEARCIVRRLVVESRTDGDWTSVELGVEGGPGAAADVLATLISAGAAVALFERIDVTLADLIERIVQDGSRGERS